MGKRHHELHGSVAFASWLAVHAWLLDTMRARVDAFINWAWDSFSHSRGPAIIDDPDAPRIDWDDPDDSSGEAAASSEDTATSTSSGAAIS
jgi:NADH dehydrogenase